MVGIPLRLQRFDAFRLGCELDWLVPCAHSYATIYRGVHFLHLNWPRLRAMERHLRQKFFSRE